MDKETLIKNLNEDLSGELSAIIQYITYAAKTTGPYRPQLSQFFLTEVADEQLHAQFLANKIVSLGGEPTTIARPVPQAKTNKEMLQAVLEAERKAVKDYSVRAEQADALGEKGLVVQLEDMVRDDVHAFYRKWYVPNNMIVTVAGNFDRNEVRQLLEQYYGSAAPGRVDHSGLRPAALIDRTRAVTRRGGDEHVVALTFEAPSYGMADFFPYLVMVQLLDLEGSGILTAALSDMPAEGRPELDVWWERASGFGRLTLQFTLPAGADPNLLYRQIQDALIGAIEMGITGEDILGIVRKIGRAHV